MKLPTYVCATKKHGEDALPSAVVIRLRRPMIVACPYSIVQGRDMTSQLRDMEEGGCAKVPEHRIFMYPCASLDRSYVSGEDLTALLNEMALVFKTECVDGHKHRFRDYVDD